MSFNRYDGGPFRAAREDNVPMLRAFFLSEGPKKMLSVHDHSDEGGGRSLLHTAAWWSSQRVASITCGNMFMYFHHAPLPCLNILVELLQVKYLCQIGANVNAIDTAYNKFTPLMEACRAGHLQVILLKIDFFFFWADNDTPLNMRIVFHSGLQTAHWAQCIH